MRLRLQNRQIRTAQSITQPSCCHRLKYALAVQCIVQAELINESAHTINSCSTKRDVPLTLPVMQGLVACRVDKKLQAGTMVQNYGTSSHSILVFGLFLLQSAL